MLEEHGLIEERVDQMVYSIDDKRFLPDRYVEGTCPHCGYDKARGDQCDNCGSLLDPTDLNDAVFGDLRLAEPGGARHPPPLSAARRRWPDRIRAWVDSNAPTGRCWPRSIAYKHLDEGLIDRGITRDLSWGIPVTKGEFPRPGFEDKVFYVWFDAPIEYIAATAGMGAKPTRDRDWERWWRTDEGADDVRYVEFMGKDNVAFHTVSFPATILGSEEPWKTRRHAQGLQLAQLVRRQVLDLAASAACSWTRRWSCCRADYWRWYLTANAPESADTAFTWEQFASAVNSDLADVLGNFVNRILKFTESKFDGVIPDGGEVGPLEEKPVRRRLGPPGGARRPAWRPSRCARPPRRCAPSGWSATSTCRGRPWTAIKTDRDRAAVIVRTALNLAALYARISRPVHPVRAPRRSPRLSSLSRPPRPGPRRMPAAELSTPAGRPRRSARQRCCSRRSRTNRSPSGRRASAELNK